MDRARVICPSVSLAAHLGGLALLTTGVLVLPDRLPATVNEAYGRLLVAPSLALSLGTGGLEGGHRRIPPVRVSNPHLPSLAPTSSREVADDPTLDSTSSVGPPGLIDDDRPGDGVGLCLENCGTDTVPGPAVAGPPTAPAPHPAPLRVHEGLREPLKLRHVAPVYPPLAIAAHVQGRVVLDCVIDEDGRVSAITVLRGQPLLEAAAVEAVRQWRYRPTLLNGTPVSVLLTVNVDFHLR